MTDSGSRWLLKILVLLTLAKLGWYAVEKCLPAATAAEPVAITQVERSLKAAAPGITVISKTP